MGVLGSMSVVAAVLAMLIGGGPARADDPSFALTIKDHKFEPAELEIPANTKVKLLVKNADPSAEEFDSKDLKREKVIPGGQEVIILVGPLKAGTYRFEGEYNSKTAKGRLLVK